MRLIFGFSLFLTTIVLFEMAISESFEDNGNITENEFSFGNGGSRVLSRQKRFLTFPDGSSVQLVFCVQTAALIPIGDIFLYGNTAALAWNLPSDTMFLDVLRQQSKAQRRGDVVKTVNYLDEEGRLISRVPYKRKPIVNPAFAKRSIDNEVKEMTFKEKLKIKIDRKKMHDKQLKRDFLKKEHLDEHSIKFHRSSRLELLEKLEKLITAMGRDGRQCVLYKLCESAQSAPVQGSFLQEFLRVVFTLPKGEEFAEDEQREYDKAHMERENCSELYPGCDNFNIPVQF
ncbi:hypothetical protein K1T71_009141 [Dendrolimus kikuchii]|uniref:Uncharacterized protein n=1 Tax=Dendrolimus kikuchii TaxID=765133 RepID=A0ACC1CTZ3_9NEOP|nr:hypothetical protein K1T71_009141 [Dendrolimus kikuchii]